MKKLAFAFALAAAMGSAYAEAIPSMTTLNARVTALGHGTVRAEVTAPKERATPWDAVNAALVGCVAEGARVPMDGTGRIGIKFGALRCAGKPAITIKAVAVSATDQMVGLHSPAGVGSPLTILLMASAKLPLTGAKY
ncbi:hypothetical protein WJ96_06830 [Burkholderia ubonensis]|uniref:Uncharacterized protein n=1 Tax=Burkholderia ubonensis TaxID=101571 RepID=A0AAW3N2K8_9BURK|nr:hypothetical protein [Burkholderia ubonensis]KVP75418.1 hypothetical protein WJ93_08625 [Burkholderia ubonensis]KVP98231.1 hypothetical protein WJ96_06830 [Burkholderia ubonensis]KVZ92928.1 hypothetical protein WL25_18490 [Burkholderia ubonensis]